MKNVFAFVVVVFALFVVGTSSMFVDTDEVAIVYRFGAVNRVVQSGLSFRFPRPIEQDERLSISEVRIADVGRVRLLTGDVNLIEAWPIAQYSIADPVAFTTQFDDPDALLKSIVEVSIVSAVGRRAVDKESFMSRNQLQKATQVIAQQYLDQMKSGIRLDSIEIKELAPPQAVADAFNEVSSARGDKDTMILSAESYASKIIPDMRGKAAEIHEKAVAEGERVRTQSIAKIDRFERLLPAWKQNPNAMAGNLKSQFWQRLQNRFQVRLVPVGSEIVIDQRAPENNGKNQSK